MKLVLANNQSDKFKEFYRSLGPEVDYSDYSSLLFEFDDGISVTNLETGRKLDDYDGVYLNGYLNTYELAATAAVACAHAGIPFVNHELSNAPSLSKLSMYAKLSAGGVGLPVSAGGSKQALLQAISSGPEWTEPKILKRADADRGIDNYMVRSGQEAQNILEPHDSRSLWILQDFVPNDGFYLVSFYGQVPKFCIYRAMEKRPDGDELKAHMYKPRGGSNASLIELEKVPPVIVQEAQKAVEAMDRQIASVDCLHDPTTDTAYILEVNYNPQLVTIETFKEVRVEAFKDYLDQKW